MLNTRIQQNLSTNLDYQCLFFNGEDSEALERLFMERNPVVFDDILQQVSDLLASRFPKKTFTQSELSELVRIELGNRPSDLYGEWVYYPWSNRLVHVLSREDFIFLRTNRNQNKITRAEQQILADKCIGIIGLSVGHSAAMALALEGVGRRFKLADFDTLSLSNLNRLRQGVHQLGINKSILAARDLLELDPYLEIEIFPDGITDSNIDSFFVGSMKIDLLVEECDDLYMKIKAREHAKKLEIPVVMDTSDRGLLDVERFDLDPNLPIFHGLIEDFPIASLKGLSTKEKVPYVMRIMDSSAMSKQMAASLVEVKETISTWPQLGSAVILGGALVADTSRRILLGSFKDSGRYYVDMEAIVADKMQVKLQSPVPLGVEVCPESMRQIQISIPPINREEKVSDAEMSYLLQHAILAPSAGNSQPWKFKVRNNRIECRLDPERGKSFLNYEDRASYVALGSAAENISIMAGQIGLNANVIVQDNFASVELTRSKHPKQDPLSKYVTLRTCNRKKAAPQNFTSSEISALRESLRSSTLKLMTERPLLKRIGAILGSADRMRFLSKQMHSDLMHELRWNAADVLRTRDGIDMSTMDLTATDLAVMRILSSWPTLEKVALLDGGSALETPSNEAVDSCSGLALLTMPGESYNHYIEGGRELQRFWLTATHLGIGLQPLGFPYMFTRLDRNKPSGFDRKSEDLVRGWRSDFRGLFNVVDGQTELILLRLVHATPAQSRSLRRSVELSLM